jgi:predicted permease
VEGTDRPAVRLPLRRDEVAGDLFATIRAPLLRGRTFSTADGPGAPRVVVINEAMAQQVWGSRDPLGRRFTFNPSSPNPAWFTVVGIVGNMRRQGLEIEATPQMFESLAQNPSPRAILLVRTAGDDPGRLVPSLRAAVRGADRQAVIYGVSTADEKLGALLAPRRLQTSLLAAFSLAALLLATLGIYGVIQYSVAARTHEIGIRMALGASLGDVFRMVVREGLVLSAVGLVLGILAALWLTRLVTTLLYGVTPTDPPTFAAASLLLIAVATAASWLPARRATRIPPIVALQQRR